VQSAAPAMLTGRQQTGYYAAPNVPTAGYGFMSQTLPELQAPCEFASRLNATEGVVQLSMPASVGSAVDVARQAGLAGDPQRAVVHSPEINEDDDDDAGADDDSSVLSLSVSRSV